MEVANPGPAIVVGHLMGSSAAEHFALNYPAVFESFIGSDFSADLDAVSVPALIVWGARDAICPRSEQEALARSIPYTRLVVYDDAGHAPHWEEPARFAGDLVEFADIAVGPIREWAAEALTSVFRADANSGSGARTTAGRL